MSGSLHSIVTGGPKSIGYLELGMFDDAAMVLEEIAPEDKTRNEVLGARVNLCSQEVGYGRSGCQPPCEG